VDEPVGQRWAMVEPALWRRRRLGSSPSHQGVCGRHGGEEACVTQGGLSWFRDGNRIRDPISVRREVGNEAMGVVGQPNSTASMPKGV